MKYQVYSEREFERILKNNGYTLVRQTGTHKIWAKEGCLNITVPQSLNPMIIRRLIKENRLVV